MTTDDDMRRIFKNAVKNKEMAAAVINVLQQDLKQREQRIDMALQILDSPEWHQLLKTAGADQVAQFTQLSSIITKLFKQSNNDVQALLYLFEASVFDNIETKERLNTLLNHYLAREEELKKVLSADAKELQQRTTLSNEDRKALDWLKKYMEHTKGEDDEQ
jgi:NDP-sugar pyrophosphorylase family protein